MPKDTKKKSIGEKLHDLRGNKTKAEVAKAIGVSESSYVKYERNERHPKDEIKIRIAKFYNTTVSYIFFS